jgi:hypothetical protein
MISTVSLRQSNRKNGKGYLFLDYHPPIKNQVTGRTYRQEYLHMTVYLNPTNKEQREHNENTMRQAEEIRSRKAIEMINSKVIVNANFKIKVSVVCIIFCFNFCIKIVVLV